jgi:hypothetical protein
LYRRTGSIAESKLKQSNGVQQRQPVTEANEPCGVHFDQFLGLIEAMPPLQLLLFDNNSAAAFSSGNEIRSDVLSLSYKSFDPHSVFGRMLL